VLILVRIVQFHVGYWYFIAFALIDCRLGYSDDTYQFFIYG